MVMSDTVSAGIDSPKVTKWLEENVSGAAGPFKFEFIAGGHSNLTFSVRDTKQNHYVSSEAEHSGHTILSPPTPSESNSL